MLPLFSKSIRQRVLVVDSDQGNAEGVVAFVAGNDLGCEVVRACSGVEGLQTIENGMVNIVVAAETLVDMTGTTFINILQCLKQSKKPDPACVLMVKDRRYIDTPDLECSTTFDVIRSPVEPDELLYALDRAMDLDGLKARIEFNKLLWKVLWGLVPMSVLLGIFFGL